jgi:hypothetical protein
MSKRKNPVLGICRVCARKAQLTFEHIPPKSAFNNNKFFFTTNIHPLLDKRNARTFEDLTSFDKSTAKKNQGGIGIHSLCGFCNNLFGTYYVRAYKEWITQSMEFFKLESELERNRFEVTIQPLNVLKQIIAMFFSINTKFSKLYPELKSYLLNKETNILPEGVRVFVYYNFIGEVRYEPFAVVGKFDANSEIIQVSEITFPPMGYVLVLNGQNADNRLHEITCFSNYQLGEVVSIPQQLNILPTHLKYILDYRTKDEIEQGLQMNRE